MRVFPAVPLLLALLAASCALLPRAAAAAGTGTEKVQAELLTSVLQASTEISALLDTAHQLEGVYKGQHIHFSAAFACVGQLKLALRRLRQAARSIRKRKPDGQGIAMWLSGAHRLAMTCSEGFKEAQNAVKKAKKAPTPAAKAAKATASSEANLGRSSVALLRGASGGEGLAEEPPKQASEDIPAAVLNLLTGTIEESISAAKGLDAQNEERKGTKLLETRGLLEHAYEDEEDEDDEGALADNWAWGQLQRGRTLRLSALKQLRRRSLAGASRSPPPPPAGQKITQIVVSQRGKANFRSIQVRRDGQPAQPAPSSPPPSLHRVLRSLREPSPKSNPPKHPKHKRPKQKSSSKRKSHKSKSKPPKGQRYASSSSSKHSSPTPRPKPKPRRHSSKSPSKPKSRPSPKPSPKPGPAPNPSRPTRSPRSSPQYPPPLTKPPPPAPKEPVRNVTFITVAQRGKGNFRTVQGALDWLGRKGTSPVTIYIRAGTYKENVHVRRQFLTLKGDGPGKTIITGNASAVCNNITTYLTATAAIHSDYVVVRDMTFRNTAPQPCHQAVALVSNSDFGAFYNVNFESFQDTLYVNSGRQYYRNCTIIGTIDFIFGNAAAFFNQCTMKMRRNTNGSPVDTLTASARNMSNDPTGIVVYNSTITAWDPDEGPFIDGYFGRPWKQYARTVIIQSWIDRLISLKGWIPWDFAMDYKQAFYGEYQNTGPGSTTSFRAPWVKPKILSKWQASDFRSDKFIMGDQWVAQLGVPYH